MVMFTWQVPKPYKRLDDALTAYGAVFKAKTKSFAATDKSSVY
jgi:hypothetical protein